MILVMAVLSIIVIAVWGTLPESNSQQQVQSLTFTQYEYNDHNDKIINVIDDITKENTSYLLPYTYLPNHANADIKATSSSSDVSVIVDELKQEVLVNFLTNDAIGKNVTITIEDRLSNSSDEITLIFKLPDVIIAD